MEKKLSVMMETKACTGCSACLNVCPTQALTMESDQEGFWYSVIDEGQCIGCGACEDVCPVIHALRSEENIMAETAPTAGGNPLIYAAWSLDQEIRYHSTSGGIFSELALSVLAKGGYVCGAIYDHQHMVKHAIIDHAQDLAKLRQSKYVQSDMNSIYKEIGNLLKQGEELLFCGSPCQCAGVFHYCEKSGIDAKNLYLVDFICRGSNSPKVYRKFLDELEAEQQSKVKKVWFKNKIYGWNRFSTKVEFENGEAYLEDRYHDAYIRGYIEENLFIRPSCAACYFKGFQRHSDLTLADFWGIQLKDDSQDIDGGTSMAIIHTEKGQTLWASVSSRIFSEAKTLEEAAMGNACLYNSALPGIHREQFMADLDRMPVMDNIKRFLK
ncbi:MAG: 4Fe-4S binding protein [Firmicutes bacterium]|jgi:coenzyme F420-reducing hydrogenase beta subunit|nr:4Fe-4S binding protein [Bacillota bacterium]